MLSVGYIYNDTHQLLTKVEEEQVTNNDFNQSLLIVGCDKAFELFPESTTFESKVIDLKKKIFYCFSKEESEIKYKEGIDNFIKHCFEEFLNSYIIKHVTFLEDLDLLPHQIHFLYEEEKFITLTNQNTIYYFNREVLTYFNPGIELVSSIEDKLGKSNLISWDKYECFNAHLKSNLEHNISNHLIKNTLGLFCDSQLYFGAYCLQWYNTLSKNDSLETWKKAFEVENYLSTIKIKIDKLSLLGFLSKEENTILSNIVESNEGGYIIQKYNGTDKITGRIYAIGSGFSLQSLSQPFRKYIVAENDSVLVEFDYNFFEYSLLAQLTKLEIIGDPHIYMSNLIFKNDEHRSICKAINYGLLYGQSVNALLDDLYSKHTIEISKKELREKLSIITQPIEELNERLTKELENKGYIVNHFGRQIFPEKKYAVVNNYIQSTAADFIINKIIKLRDFLLSFENSKIVLQNHDSILLNLSTNDLDNNVAEGIKEILLEEEKGLKGTVDLKYGSTWGNLK